MPPVRVGVEKPVWSNGTVQPMRPQPRRMNDTADRAVCDEFFRHDGRGHHETLGETDREDAPRLAHRLLDSRQLIERGDARLVDHHVLAMRHGVDRYSRPIAGNGSADDHVDRRILKKTTRIVRL